jgi:hypothetical protein
MEQRTNILGFSAPHTDTPQIVDQCGLFHPGLAPQNKKLDSDNPVALIWSARAAGYRGEDERTGPSTSDKAALN